MKKTYAKPEVNLTSFENDSNVLLASGTVQSAYTKKNYSKLIATAEVTNF